MGTREVPFSSALGEVVDNRGKTCPTADSGIPLIATNCIRNELLYPAYEKVRFVSPQTYSTWFRGHPRPGDILFVNRRSWARVRLCLDPAGLLHRARHGRGSSRPGQGLSKVSFRRPAFANCTRANRADARWYAHPSLQEGRLR